jgi:hypothetical protein
MGRLRIQKFTKKKVSNMGVMDYGGIDKKETELLQFELLKMDNGKQWPPSL